MKLIFHNNKIYTVTESDYQHLKKNKQGENQKLLSDLKQEIFKNSEYTKIDLIL